MSNGVITVRVGCKYSHFYITPFSGWISANILNVEGLRIEGSEGGEV